MKFDKMGDNQLAKSQACCPPMDVFKPDETRMKYILKRQAGKQRYRNQSVTVGQ